MCWVSVYDICKFYRKNLDQIEFLLTGPINKSGYIYLNIVRKQDRMKNINFIKVVRNLFYDDKIKRFKKGTGIDRGMDRLVELYNQYERSFDMYSMPSEYFIDHILKKKHRELKKFFSQRKIG